MARPTSPLTPKGEGLAVGRAWHFLLENATGIGAVTFSKSTQGHFTTFIHAADNPSKCVCGSGPTPMDAVRAALAKGTPQ